MKKTKSLSLLRLQKEIQKKLPFLISTNYPEFSHVTVSSVLLSPDYSFARVNCASFIAKDEKDMILSLQKLAPQLQKDLAKSLTVRHIPKLTFFLETGFSKTEKIERLIADTTKL